MAEDSPPTEQEIDESFDKVFNLLTQQELPEAERTLLKVFFANYRSQIAPSSTPLPDSLRRFENLMEHPKIADNADKTCLGMAYLIVDALKKLTNESS